MVPVKTLENGFHDSFPHELRLTDPVTFTIEIQCLQLPAVQHDRLPVDTPQGSFFDFVSSQDTLN